MTLSTARINAELRRNGIKARLISGRMRYYFVGEDVKGARSTTVAVRRLNVLTIDEWVDKAQRIRALAKAGR